MSEWFPRLGQYFSFPRDYTVVDTETSGLQPAVAEICVIGLTVVRGGQPVSTREDYVNWFADASVDRDAVEKRLLATQKVMEGNNKAFLHTRSKLEAAGRPPVEVFSEYLALFEDLEARGEVLVAHNGIAFDLPFFVAHFHNVLKVDWKFREDLVFDTGIAVKASQMPDVPFPRPEESLFTFMQRIGRTPRKIRWALDKYCEETWGLTKKAGVSPGLAHTAGVDSLLTATLMEEIRKLAKPSDG